MQETGERIQWPGLLRPELRDWMEGHGEPAYRGDQLFEWIHRHRATSFGQMTNLPKALRSRLAEAGDLVLVETVAVQVDPEDGTRKYLLRLLDGEAVEAALMRYRHGLSLCVSSQVGCRMGCRFCASTIGGKVRDLSAGEMVAQVLQVQRDLDPQGERVGNVVVMGIGEPLENYEATVRFLRLVHDERGLSIGWRHLTVSTSGLAPAIRRLADEGLPVTLAVSLHAPNDYLRTQLMPINVRHPVAELMEACRYYVERTGRRISFEYIMIDGVNDHPDLARDLAILLKGLLCHVNLIPCNPVPERPYRPSPPERIARFRRVLERAGIPVTVRRTLGRNIDAACGQLRRRAALAR